MTVRVVTDSAAALDAATAAAAGITVVPLQVMLGGGVYRDGDLSPAELVDRWNEGVTTSGPTPGAFTEVLAGLPGEVLVLTLAESLSSTHRAALAAAAGFGERVRVVDSGTAAGGQALAALGAAEVARANGTLADVEAAARHVASRVRLYAAFDTLEYLIRGGRIGRTVGGMADRIGVCPVIELSAGRIHRLRPAFSRQGAIDRLIGKWRAGRVDGARLHLVVLETLARADADDILRRIRSEVEPATGLISDFGAVIAAHTGPGLIGLSWWWEQDH